LSKSTFQRVGTFGTEMIYPTMEIVGLTFGQQRFGEASAYAMFFVRRCVSVC
jgi:uncharacterized membrane protein